ncbi:MAG: DUF4199 domain-containing protein [Spirosomaceae bacterium]|jgi:hypothetical protein|nr:DUF4199 domain-containing protein [Spirosomataceae bacterium]
MEKPSTARIALKWGVIVGIVVIIFSTITSMADLWKQSWASWIGYLFVLGGLIMALGEFKKANEGFMGFGEGLGLGTLMSTVVGVLGAIFSYIYLNFIDTTMVSRIVDFQREKMSEQGLSDEQIDQAMEMTAKFMSPGMMFIFGVLGYLIVGFILTLIVSAIMKKSKPEVEF